jgi:hypothetical protein
MCSSTASSEHVHLLTRQLEELSQDSMLLNEKIVLQAKQLARFEADATASADKCVYQLAFNNKLLSPIAG